MFAVRITRDFPTIKPFFDKLVVSHPDSVLIAFQHDADEDVSRTHVHMALVGVNPSTDTLKRWIKNECGISSMSRYDWSFKQLESLDGYVTYMSKGTLDPVFLHNIEYDKVTALRAEWKELREQRPEKDKREDVTAYSMAEELAKWIDDNAVRKKIYQDKFQKILIDDDLTDREIVLQCIKIHNKYRKGFCDFSLIRVIQTAYGLCSHEKWRDALVVKVCEKLSPRIV